MQHIKKTCAQAWLVISLLAATGSVYAQLGSAEASIANLTSLVQVCTDAYPQQNLPVKVVLQAAVKGHFGEGSAGDIKYRQMLSGAEVKAYTAQSVQELKQQLRQGKLDLQKACLSK